MYNNLCLILDHVYKKIDKKYEVISYFWFFYDIIKIVK